MRKNRGSAMVEASLMMPWLVFLFVGTLDFGFYSYAAICTENAARAAAVASSSGSSLSPCNAALAELIRLPNVSSVTCPTGTTVSSGSPVAAWVDQLCSVGCTATCADCAVDTTATSARATVIYQTMPMVPIPGVLTGVTRITRIVEMRSSN